MQLEPATSRPAQRNPLCRHVLAACIVTTHGVLIVAVAQRELKRFVASAKANLELPRAVPHIGRPTQKCVTRETLVSVLGAALHTLGIKVRLLEGWSQCPLVKGHRCCRGCD